MYLIVIVCGLEGTGKTTVSKELATLIHATVLSTDKIRKELLAYPSYHEKEMDLIYDTMILIAKYLQDNKINCILDATFRKEQYRKKVYKVLNKKKIFMVECICSEETAISRISTRKNDYSDAKIETYYNTKKVFDRIKQPHIVIETTKPAKVLAEKIQKEYLLE